MELRRIGNSDLLVSTLGLGCHNFEKISDASTSTCVVHRALDLGVSLFDTALLYGDRIGGAERILGSALGPRRKDVTIITKGGVVTEGASWLRGDSSRANLTRNIEASLRHLGTDYVDIFMLHLPDNTTPIEETLDGLNDIVTSGKARYIACSNMTAWRLVDALWIARTEGWHRFIASENEFSLLSRRPERELLPALEKFGLGLIPHTPLGHGLLTGKFFDGVRPPDTRLAQNIWGSADRYLTPDRLRIADDLDRFAADHDHSLLDLAFGWLLSHSAVPGVIAGASNPDQVYANAAAATAWKLSDDEIAQANKIARSMA